MQRENDSILKRRQNSILKRHSFLQIGTRFFDTIYGAMCMVYCINFDTICFFALYTVFITVTVYSALYLLRLHYAVHYALCTVF